MAAHHDGVTGTARWRVVQDYTRQLSTAISDSYVVIAAMADSLLRYDTDDELDEQLIRGNDFSENFLSIFKKFVCIMFSFIRSFYC